MELDGKALSERSIEYCISSRIGEISKNDSVFLRKMSRLPRAPKQSSGCSCGEHNNRRYQDRPPATHRSGGVHARGSPFRCCVSPGDRCDEAIPASRERLDKSRVVGGVSQRFAQLINRRVQAVVEVNEGISGPVLIAQLFASDYFPGPLQQEREDVKGLFLHLDSYAQLAHLTSAQIYLKHSETQDCGRSGY